MARIVDITNKKYGTLKVISYSHTEKYGAMWNCICDCGNTCKILGQNLRRGNSKTCRKCHTGMKGKKHSSKTILKMRETRLKLGNFPRHNIKHSKESKEKMSIVKKGSKCHLWRGGITPINKKIRSSLEYRLWRIAVLERDNYTCVWGGKEHIGKLQVDHIKPFCNYPELRFAIDNGRTLCVECHKTTDTWGRKALSK